MTTHNRVFGKGIIMDMEFSTPSLTRSGNDAFVTRQLPRRIYSEYRAASELNDIRAVTFEVIDDVSTTVVEFADDTYDEWEWQGEYPTATWIRTVRHAEMED